METSYNGWPASRNSADFGGLEPLVVAGEVFAPGVRAGDVRVVLGWVAEQLHARVEPVVRPDWHQADDWGYSYRPNVNNPTTLSCHASGTAIDYNATRHPNGKRGTFTAEQVTEIHKILSEIDGAVRWGGDFIGARDEMHFEVIAAPGTLARVAAQLRGGVTPMKHATIQEGSTGPDVSLLQRFLGVQPVSGYFGPLTAAAVRRYQSMRGLTVDAICGPATWREIGL